MSVPLAIVVAVAENGTIGVGGGLPWRIKADLRKFRAITMGKPLIMGRKTFQSIGRVLDGREVIVITRQRDYAPGGVSITKSPEAALSLAQARAAERGAAEICIAGGGEIYEAAMPYAHILYVTHVSGRPEGDVRFPDISPAEWRVTSREPLPQSEGDTATGAHVVYTRRR